MHIKLDALTNQRILGKIQQIKEPFEEGIKQLSQHIKDNSCNIMQIIDNCSVLLGYEKFIKMNSTIIEADLDDALKDFIFFIHAFDILFQKVSSKRQEKKDLIGKLKKHLQPNDNINAFIHELEAYIQLVNLGFTIDLSDLARKTSTDFIATQGYTHFNIECKTLSKFAGSPVRQEGLQIFCQKIHIKSYTKISIGNSVIHFPFGGDLNQTTAKELADKFNSALKNSNLEITKITQPIKDLTTLVDIINSIHTANKGSFIIGSIEPKEHHTFILLKPLKKKDYVTSLEKQVYTAIEQFARNSNNYPDVLYLHLRGFSSDIDHTPHQILNAILKPFIDQHNKPLLILVRGDYSINREVKPIPYYNEAFAPYIQNYGI